MPRFLLSSAVLLAILQSSCSTREAYPPRINIGMELDAARQLIESNGGKNVVMAIVTAGGDVHPNVYDLPNGKVVILGGHEILDSITVIENPEDPKVEREFTELTEFMLPQSNDLAAKGSRKSDDDSDPSFANPFN